MAASSRGSLPPAADVQSTVAPAAAMDWPRLLLVHCCIGCPGSIEAPGRGGLARPALGGPPDQMRHIFPGRCGSMGTRAAADSVVAWLVSRTASPHSAPGTARLAGGASRLRFAPSGFTRRGRGMCACGVESNRGGPASGGLGSTVAMGALERSSDQLQNGPVVGTVSGGSFVRTETDPERQPSPRLGCETRSGCKRAV